MDKTTQALVLTDLLGRTTITVPEAGRFLGVGRSAAYDAAKRQEIPTICVGRRLLVPVPRLLALIGYESSDAAVR